MKWYIILLAADDGMPKDCCSNSKDQFDLAVAAICLPITIPLNDFWFQGMAIPVVEFSREEYKIRKVFD